MSEKINSFRDLKVWQEGIKLVKTIYAMTAQFPSEEQYCLSAQMRRAAISIPSNVAEGFKRFHDKEQRQFFSVALGSCAELETQLVIVQELGYVNAETIAQVNERIDHISRMIVNLRKKCN